MIKRMMALDWRVMKIHQKRLLLFPAVALLLGSTNFALFPIPLMVFAFSTASTYVFALEEKGSLNNFYLALPVSRRNIVAGRYAFDLTFTLFAIALGVPVALLSNVLNPFSNWYIGAEGYFAVAAVSVLAGAVLNICRNPILFKFGYVKGKFWGVWIPAIFTCFCAMIYVFITQSRPTATIELISYASENLLLIGGGMLAAAAILLCASYLISVRVYSGRDF